MEDFTEEDFAQDHEFAVHIRTKIHTGIYIIKYEDGKRCAYHAIHNPNIDDYEIVID